MNKKDQIRIKEQVKDLQDSLKRAREGLIKQDGALKQLTALPLIYATVVAIHHPPMPRKPRRQTHYQSRQKVKKVKI